MREDLCTYSLCILLPLRLFHDFVSFMVVVSPFTLQAQHSLHCIHGSQMDMPLETLLGPG